MMQGCKIWGACTFLERGAPAFGDGLLAEAVGLLWAQRGAWWVLTRYHPGPGCTLRPVVTDGHGPDAVRWTARWAYVVSRLSHCGFPRTLQCGRVFNSERICRKPFKQKWWTKPWEEEPTGRETAGARAVAWASPGDLRLLGDSSHLCLAQNKTLVPWTD